MGGECDGPTYRPIRPTDPLISSKVGNSPTVGFPRCRPGSLDPLREPDLLALVSTHVPAHLPSCHVYPPSGSDLLPWYIPECMYPGAYNPKHSVTLKHLQALVDTGDARVSTTLRLHTFDIQENPGLTTLGGRTNPDSKEKKLRLNV